jgi:hypothetical protein
VDVFNFGEWSGEALLHGQKNWCNFHYLPDADEKGQR